MPEDLGFDVVRDFRLIVFNPSLSLKADLSLGV